MKYKFAAVKILENLEKAKTLRCRELPPQPLEPYVFWQHPVLLSYWLVYYYNPAAADTEIAAPLYAAVHTAD